MDIVDPLLTHPLIYWAPAMNFYITLFKNAHSRLWEASVCTDRSGGKTAVHCVPLARQLVASLYTLLLHGRLQRLLYRAPPFIFSLLILLRNCTGPYLSQAPSATADYNRDRIESQTLVPSHESVFAYHVADAALTTGKTKRSLSWWRSPSW